MVSRRKLRTFLSTLALYVGCALMIGYFGVNAYTGNHGLRAQQDLDQQFTALTDELGRLKRERGFVPCPCSLAFRRAGHCSRARWFGNHSRRFAQSSPLRALTSPGGYSHAGHTMADIVPFLDGGHSGSFAFDISRRGMKLVYQ